MTAKVHLSNGIPTPRPSMMANPGTGARVSIAALAETSSPATTEITQLLPSSEDREPR